MTKMFIESAETLDNQQVTPVVPRARYGSHCVKAKPGVPKLFMSRTPTIDAH